MYKRVTEHVIKQIKPGLFVEQAIRVENNRLNIGTRTYELKGNVSVLGFGKAALGMYSTLKRELGDHVKKCYLSVPHSSPIHLEMDNDTMTTVVRAARNNLPDENAVRVTRDIIKYAETLASGDLCICLISGGGSALLCDPIVPLPDMLSTIQLMTSRSATIQQLNTVRTYLCSVKGGGLARYAAPASVLSLIISDVVGDPLKYIASGPTVPTTVSTEDVRRTLTDLSLCSTQLPAQVQELLSSHHSSHPVCSCHGNSALYSCHGNSVLYSCHGNSVCSNDIYNFILASNKIALGIAASTVEKEGYTPFVITDTLAGEAREVAGELIYSVTDSDIEREYQHLTSHMLQKIKSALSSDASKVCFILGGETTVTIRGSGSGGRCQELALAAALQLGRAKTRCKIALVATSTDGQDGPTDASGAMVNQDTMLDAVRQHVDAEQLLNDNDSHTFFSLVNGGENILRSGLTGTNLMDIVFIFIEK